MHSDFVNNIILTFVLSLIYVSYHNSHQNVNGHPDNLLKWTKLCYCTLKIDYVMWYRLTTLMQRSVCWSITLWSSNLFCSLLPLTLLRDEIYFVNRCINPCNCTWYVELYVCICMINIFSPNLPIKQQNA